jgi:hypothetical protein
MFDLKQALADNVALPTSTLDNDCFSALTNAIGTATTTEIEQEQFYQWIRVHFPTVFYGFELWLRKNSVLSNSNNTAQETVASVAYIIITII